jgi:hypothetical protein
VTGTANTTALTANTAAITALTASLTGHAAITAASAAATTANTASTTASVVSTTTQAASTDANTLATMANTIATWAADVGSFLGFAVGADNIPHDMVAQIHQGEMIVPAGPASVLRARGLRSGYELNDLARSGGFSLDASRLGSTVSNTSGGDVHMQYAPTINAKEPATLSQMLDRESGQMLGWLNRQFRNGALRAA